MIALKILLWPYWQILIWFDLFVDGQKIYLFTWYYYYVW